MKKYILIFVLIIWFSFNNAYSVNYNKLHEKIDSIYEKNPEKLLKLNNQLKILLKKNYSNDKKIIINDIYKYINFKFKNNDYYNLSVSDSTKISVKEIIDSSFTNQENITKLNELFKNNFEISLIDKEYINYYIYKNNVSILLNHQNFKDAKEITKEYFKKDSKNYDYNKLDFIAKNIDYASFWIIPQLVSWINPEKKQEVIEYRIKYYPDEEQTAYNQVRIYWYEWIDCDKLKIKDPNIDLIDKNLCKILNWKFDLNDLKEVDKLSNNIQNLSDRSNYYSYVAIYHTEYTEDMMDKKRIISETIINNDKNYINWYIWLLKYYDYKNDCINFYKYNKLLFENFIWDDDSKNEIKNKYNFNCSK